MNQHPFSSTESHDAAWEAKSNGHPKELKNGTTLLCCVGQLYLIISGTGQVCDKSKGVFWYCMS